jgi:hypothetical protein
MVRSSQIVPNVLPNGQSAFEKHEIILVFDVALVEAAADSLAHEAMEYLHSWFE